MCSQHLVPPYPTKSISYAWEKSWDFISSFPISTGVKVTYDTPVDDWKKFGSLATTIDIGLLSIGGLVDFRLPVAMLVYSVVSSKESHGHLYLPFVFAADESSFTAVVYSFHLIWVTYDMSLFPAETSGEPHCSPGSPN